MPLFTRLELVSSAFSTHAASFRKLYEFHSLSCGTPMDFLQLAPKLASSEGFRLDFSDLARTVRDRERGRLSAADMLTIAALGIGGAGVTEAELELYEAAGTVQVLLAGVGGWREEGAAPTFLRPAERTPEVDDRSAAAAGDVIESRLGRVSDHGAGGGSSWDGVERVAAPAGGSPEMTEALSRLEMASLQLKMYLDDIDRRMGRIEPNLEELTAMVQSSAERLRRKEVQIRPAAAETIPEEIAAPETPRARRTRSEDAMAAAMDRAERERGGSPGAGWDSDAFRDPSPKGPGKGMGRDVGGYPSANLSLGSKGGVLEREAVRAPEVRPRGWERNGRSVGVEAPEVAGVPASQGELARASAGSSATLDPTANVDLPSRFGGDADGRSLRKVAWQSPAMELAQVGTEDLEPVIETAEPVFPAAKALPPTVETAVSEIDEGAGTAAVPGGLDDVSERAGSPVKRRVWPAPPGANAAPAKVQARPPRIWVAKRDHVPQTPETAATHLNPEIQAVKPVLDAAAPATSGSEETVPRLVEHPQAAVSTRSPELRGSGPWGRAAQHGSAVAERQAFPRPGVALATSKTAGATRSPVVAFVNDLRSGRRRGMAGWGAVAAALLLTLASTTYVYQPWRQAHSWDVLGWTARPGPPDRSQGVDSGAGKTSASGTEVAAVSSGPSSSTAEAPRSRGSVRNPEAGGRRAGAAGGSTGMTNKVAERPAAPRDSARPAQQTSANGSSGGAPGSSDTGASTQGAGSSAAAPTGTKPPLADPAGVTTTARKDEGSASTDGSRNRVEGARAAEAPKAIRVENLHPDGVSEGAPVGAATSSPGEGAGAISRVGAAALTPASLNGVGGAGGSTSRGDVPRPAGPRIGGGGAAGAAPVTTGGTVLMAPLPLYPERARQMGIQGTVVIRATVDKDGKVKMLQVVEGPVLLQQSAQDAVRRRRYKPFVSGGQPTEFQTLVTLNYKLAK